MANGTNIFGTSKLLRQLQLLALVQFRTGPKPDGIKHTGAQSHTPSCCACTSSALFRQSSPSAWCETALAPQLSAVRLSISLPFCPALALGLIAEYPNKFVGKRWHANPTFLFAVHYLRVSRRTYQHTNAWSYVRPRKIDYLLIVPARFLFSARLLFFLFFFTIDK